MRRSSRRTWTACLFLALFGLFLLNGMGSGIAFAADWAEGRLVKITGNKSAVVTDKTKKPDLSGVQLTMDWDKTFGLSSDVRIKDMKSNYVTVDTLEPPIKVRYLAEDGVIQELVIIEVMQR